MQCSAVQCCGEKQSSAYRTRPSSNEVNSPTPLTSHCSCTAAVNAVCSHHIPPHNTSAPHFTHIRCVCSTQTMADSGGSTRFSIACACITAAVTCTTRRACAVTRFNAYAGAALALALAVAECGDRKEREEGVPPLPYTARGTAFTAYSRGGGGGWYGAAPSQTVLQSGSPFTAAQAETEVEGAAAAIAEGCEKWCSQKPEPVQRRVESSACNSTCSQTAGAASPPPPLLAAAVAAVEVVEAAVL